MYEITVRETFRASHHLRYPDGSWETPHEHDWNVELTLAGPQLDALDLLVDFVPLRAAVREVLAPLTGTSLNTLECFRGRNPSAERVAEYIASRLAPHIPAGVALVCVEVEEETGCFARIRPAGAPPP